jgi:hypothetical protein
MEQMHEVLLGVISEFADDEEVSAVFALAEKYQAECGRLKVEIEKATADRAAADTEVLRIEKDYAVARANQILSGDRVPDSLTTSLAEAREAERDIAVLLMGLNQKLAASETELIDAALRVNFRRSIQEKLLAAFAPIYAESTRNFVSTLRLAHAIFGPLKIDLVNLIRTQIFDLPFGTYPVYSLSDGRSPSWILDDGAAQVNRELSDFLRRCTEIQRAASSSRVPVSASRE